MDEEENDDELGGLSEALRSFGSTTAEAQEEARGILQRYREFEDDDSPEASILERMRDDAEEVRSILSQVREKIARQRYNPGEMLLAASSALGRPTKFGTLGEMMSNVSGALMEPLARREQFNRDRESDLAELDVQMARLDDPATAAEFDLHQLDRKLRTDMAKKALDILGRSVRPGSGSGSSSTAKISERDKKIAEVFSQLQRMGLEPQDAWDRAVNIVDGNERIEIVPELGAARLINEITNEVREIPLGPAEGAGDAADVTQTDSAQPSATAQDVISRLQSAPVDAPSLWDLASRATGPWSAMRQGVSVVSGMVGLPIFEETAEARQSLVNEKNDLIRALSINPKFPASEIARLDQEINIAPSLVDNPYLMQARMKAIDTSLRRRRDALERDAQDPRMPQSQREADLISVRDINKFLSILGAPRDLPFPEELPESFRADWPFLNEEEQIRLIELYFQAEGAQ